MALRLAGEASRAVGEVDSAPATHSKQRRLLEDELLLTGFVRRFVLLVCR